MHRTATPRIAALALALIVNLALLVGIDGLAQHGDADALLAQAAAAAAAARG